MSNPTGDALGAMGIKDTQRLTGFNMKDALNVHNIAMALRKAMSAALSRRGWYQSRVKMAATPALIVE